MKVEIRAESQQEFDEKRPELIKAIAGSRLEVEIRKVGEKRSTDSRPAHFKAQQEMLDFWDRKFKEVLLATKLEIGEIIGKS